MTDVVLTLEDSDFWTTVFLIALFAINGLAAAWLMTVGLTRRTVFYATGVTVESVWGSRRFERAQLHGWRWGGEESGLAIVELYRKDDPRPFRIWVPKIVDATLEAWFGDARDMAFDETKAAVADIEGDETFGATPADRVKAADAETVILRWAYWLVLALAMWVWLFPRPYHLAVGVAIVLPIAILFLTFLRQGRWRLWVAPSEFRASPTPHLFLCIWAIVLRAFLDWRIIDWHVLAAIVVFVGGVIAVAVLVALGERFSNRDRVFGAFFGAMLYAYGAVVPLNMWLDNRAPESLRGVVIQLDPEQVVIAAPPPFQQALDIEISPRLSERLAVGEEVCIDLYRGAFVVRSYDVHECE